MERTFSTTSDIWFITLINDAELPSEEYTGRCFWAVNVRH